MNGFEQLMYGFNWGLGAAAGVCLLMLVVLTGWIVGEWIVNRWRY